MDAEANFARLVRVLAPLGWKVEELALQQAVVSPSGEIWTYREWVASDKIICSRDVVFERWEQSKRRNPDDPRYRVSLEEWSALARALDELANDGGLEAFFSPLAPALTQWASRRNVQVYPYATSCQRWLFDFRHPAGGSAYVAVNRLSRDRLSIDSSLRLRDTQKLIDYLWGLKGPELDHASDRLIEELDNQLKAICGVDTADKKSATTTDPFGEYIENSPSEISDMMMRYTKSLDNLSRPRLP